MSAAERRANVRELTSFGLVATSLIAAYLAVTGIEYFTDLGIVETLKSFTQSIV